MDLVAMLHTQRSNLLSNVIGGTEETTTGVIRLRAMAAAGKLALPGDGGQRRADQALLRQPLRHRSEHHRRHYPRHQRVAGWQELCGRRLRLVQQGYRHARRGMGSNVIVTEVDPLRALEAVMDGFRVMPMLEAAKNWSHLLQRNRRHARGRQATSGSDARWRHPLQQRPLRHRDRPQVAEKMSTKIVRVREFLDEYHAGRWSPPLCGGRRSPGQPGRSRRSPQRGDGHELCQPGPGSRVYAQARPGR
jgi:hypothetical protein